MRSPIILLFIALIISTTTVAQNEIYELRVYEMNLLKPNEIVHQYLEKALIPALNRQGIAKIGAFGEIYKARKCSNKF